ncbi:MAG: ADOP family duplicated permease [Bryobacteraceae bacterium]|nr:ADOP family duplicated permease [Bryobacteraceae bacterium]
MLRKLRLRLRGVLRPHDLRDELELHIAQLTDQFISDGLNPQEAAIAARRRFGNTGRIEETSRELFALRLIDDAILDLRHSCRSLQQNPSVAVSAVISMGLAIGVNTLVFSLVQDVFLSAPTTRAPEELISIQLAQSSHSSLANLRDLEASGSVAKLAGYDLESTVNWRTADTVKQTPVMLVSENYFEVLEARAVVGRVFGSDESKAELNPHLAVITHRLWTRHFAQDPAIAGKVMLLNGRPYEVLGVLPEGFRPPTILNCLPDLYLPVSSELSASLGQRRSNTLMLFGRRKPGQTVEQARAALQVATARLAQEHARENARLAGSIRVSPLSGYAMYLDPDALPLIGFAGLLLVAVFIVLWIACVNVAGVLTARAAARYREIATRLALGASPGRLVRQLLTEALLLAVLGAVVGLSLQSFLAGLINGLALPLPVPVVFQIRPNITLIAYSIFLTAVAALLAGLAPSWQATRPGLVGGLKGEQLRLRKPGTGFRNSMIFGQVAVTVTLLFVAVLFTRSLVRVASMNPGFDLRHTAWAKISLLRDRYPKDQAFRFASGALDAASAVAGVESAALATRVPFNNFLRSGTAIHTRSRTANVEHFSTGVTGGYFDTMGIPLLAGRSFSAADRNGAPRVAVLNQALAKRLFGEGSAIGERIWLGQSKEGSGIDVVGVVGDSKHLTMGESQAFAIYDSIAQTQPEGPEVNILVRAKGDSEGVVMSVRNTLSSLDATAAVDVRPLRTSLAFAYLPSQIGAAFVGSIGALGLVLALIGIYGTMTFAVSRRTAEIGIRVALGATASQVLAAVLGTSLLTICAGLLAGIGAAIALARPLSFLLAQGVTPLDGLTLASVVAICLLVALIAAILPAKRALSVEPVSALRVE